MADSRKIGGGFAEAVVAAFQAHLDNHYPSGITGEEAAAAICGTLDAAALVAVTAGAAHKPDRDSMASLRRLCINRFQRAFDNATAESPLLDARTRAELLMEATSEQANAERH
ncbi:MULTISPECIES: hypothetical protein [unclassified Chelatococcus]|uniref:hypothetical protein n=1 Tax=unclassified Chelatococcus TaxID=2638111 RepID=UPI001BD0F46A|nr:MULTISPECIES: hypothetical protein [unclassified Chelatococcus]CAH1670507.1 hypothetical protein CHELA41_23402 [Hyphomicrobiales bacterium]MBS7738346.1 hypothetical protein [Chelatococcus sp. HY11]MBX3545874.1 hypothetical protein [Chelatococcus sp.]MCO5077308.1 hypothetical protein [Chelatococcus sp.]CAH1677261.1 hypothetical protein CHELA20_51610 [Hyphomicrobiales bacterium]